MKVFDLRCANHHVFEGWFASEADFLHQKSLGLLTCPMCEDPDVTKMLSAPRLNLGATESASDAAPSARSAQAPAVPQSAPSLPTAVAAQAALLQMVRHVVANTEDVGTRFPELARQMHYGETEDRNIRGQASPAEVDALRDEGIEVLPLPLPRALKEPLQ
jgi:hypothetical protein